MILDTKTQRFDNYSVNDFVTTKQLLKILEKKNEFREDLIRIFKLDESKINVIKIGNAKFLLDSVFQLDSQCEKIDITSKVKDIHLKKMLEAEKAIFEVFTITNDFILRENLSDLLLVESRYSSKSDILDYYSFSKFANYCRDNDFEDLLTNIKDYLNSKNFNNNEEKKLRLLYKYENKKFYLRAITSSQDYKDFGINFSVFVALIALGKYVEISNNEIYINSYFVDDSNVYISFALRNEVKVNNNISLEFNLILENDEIKRNAVSFNGVFKLKYKDNNNVSEIYLKPKGVKKDDVEYPVDLLNYQHRGSVDKVFEKIEELPDLIDYFIKQVSEDAIKISKIRSPDDIRKFISYKVKYSKKVEFQVYKDIIYKKLMSITVDSTFRLFELLREVDDLFEHNDIVSRNFWRTKLYESLIERE
jgi:hypothetical protein